MDTIVDDVGVQIARRVRLERAARGWSQAALAAASGVAKATISKIEREEMSPTAVLLVRLAGAFDLTLAGLLVRAETDGARLMREGAQAVWRDPATGYERRQVFGRPDHPVEIVDVMLPGGAAVDFPARSYARIRQAVWVRAGVLTVVEDGVRHVLQPGDCLGFGPPAPVRLANESGGDCRYVVVLARS